MLYSHYLKPILYTIDKCIVGRYIFFIIFNCLRILTRALFYICYFDAVRWRADTEITQKSSSAAVVVQVSTSPGFDRIWDRDGSGPRFDSDSTFVTNVVSVSNTSSIDMILLSYTSLIKID